MTTDEAREAMRNGKEVTYTPGRWKGKIKGLFGEGGEVFAKVEVTWCVDTRAIGNINIYRIRDLGLAD